jgi:acid phosphatase type 7
MQSALLFTFAAFASSQTLKSTVTHMSGPVANATVTWSGIKNPSSEDWITISCGPAFTDYFWWYYVTTVASSGSQDITLWANGKNSTCDTIAVQYKNAAGTTVAQTAPITIAPMIQQMRLSLVSDPTSMVVDFVSSGFNGDAYGCSYGTSPDALTQSVPAATTRVSTIGTLANALLTGLEIDTRYYYACTDGELVSDVYSFLNQPSVESLQRPITVAVFADFGVDDGFGLDQITTDAVSGKWDAICHAGDWAYNFESSNSANGNFFLNRAMMYSSNYPVLPAPGNHEAGANFFEYQVRHGGVAANSNTKSAMYYSLNWKGIHFLAFNSETYIQGGIADMLDFMRNDLASVNRTETPWVVAFSHKLWWHDNTDFSQISSILQDGNVDVLFAGHWHYYYRQIPLLPSSDGTSIEYDKDCLSADNHTYTDPKYITMITSGAPGDVERNDACPGSAEVAPFLPACSSAYGYGWFTVYNSTVLRWDFEAQQTDIGSESGAKDAVITYTDYVIIKKTKAPM